MIILFFLLIYDKKQKRSFLSKLSPCFKKVSRHLQTKSSTWQTKETSQAAARRICELAKLSLEDKEPYNMKNILNENAVRNAFAVDMAMGGSSNSVLHMLAIAKEADVNFELSDINAISHKVSHISYWEKAIEGTAL